MPKKEIDKAVVLMNSYYEDKKIRWTLKAGRTTNFIFKIKGTELSDKEIEQINSIATRSKIMDRIAKIQSKGDSFKFAKTERQIFSNSLVLIDSLPPYCS